LWFKNVVCVRRQNDINPDHIRVAVNEATVFLCWKKVLWIVIIVIVIIIIIIIIVILLKCLCITFYVHSTHV